MATLISKPLLTVNGVPPQVVSQLAQAELVSLTDRPTRNKDYSIRLSALSKPAKLSGIGKCNAVCVAIAGAMKTWGVGLQAHAFDVHYRNLKIGGTTFDDGLHLHSDSTSQIDLLNGSNRLCFRVLCASSMPAHFVDLTSSATMESDLRRFMINNAGWPYRSTLLDYARQREAVLEPAAGDIVVFDMLTPHQPQPAVASHLRILYSGQLYYDLPQNWRERVRGGDVPRLIL